MVLVGNAQARRRIGSARLAMSLESEEQLDFDVRTFDNRIGGEGGA